MRSGAGASLLRLVAPWIAVAALVGGARAEVPERMEAGEIPHYRVVREGLATGGKPSAEALQRLKAQGFKTVVDLRTEGEGIASEKEAVEAQGLRYVSVPVSAATLQAADVLAVAKVLEDADAAPVLLHCATANRVGALWALLKVREGRSLDEAEGAGREIGLTGDVMVEAVRRVAPSLAPRPTSSP